MQCNYLCSSTIFAALAALALVGYRNLPDRVELESAVRVVPTDLGLIWAQQAYVHRLTLCNCTEREITIARFVPSCSCVSVVPDAVTLSALGKVDIDVVADLSRYAAHECLHKPKEWSVQIRPVLKEKELRVQPLRLSAMVQSPVALRVPVIDLGADLIRGMSSTSEPIRLQVADRVQSLSFNSSVPFLTASGESTGTSDHQICVRFTGEFPVGPMAAMIEIAALDRNGFQFPPISLPVRGIVQEDLTLEPRTLYVSSNDDSRHVEQESPKVRVATRSGQRINGIEVLSKEGDVSNYIRSSVEPRDPNEDVFIRFDCIGKVNSPLALDLLIVAAIEGRDTDACVNLPVFISP